MKKEITLGLLGLGTVGSGVVTGLQAHREQLEKHVGAALRISKALVRNLRVNREADLTGVEVVTAAQAILTDPAIDIVVELIGGEQPALSYWEAALHQGKHLVSANKEVLAKHGPRLRDLARRRGVGLAYEASVGGGIPIIAALQGSLVANQITSVRGIVNGTTNYILSKMQSERQDFSQALSEAQQLGYAEADPRSDIEGYDAAYKLAILAQIAFGAAIHPDQIFREGIAHVTQADCRFSFALGCNLKLLAIATLTGTQLDVRVHPALLPYKSMLAQVDNVFNAIEVQSSLAGKQLFYGRGAGGGPTASAVLADIASVAGAIAREEHPVVYQPYPTTYKLRPVAEIESKFFLRVQMLKQEKAWETVSDTLRHRGIGATAATPFDPRVMAGPTVDMALITQATRLPTLQAGIKDLQNLSLVHEVGLPIRVEEELS